MNTVSETNIPKDDSLFGFCDIVDNTLTYFMNTDDSSVRMLGALCGKDKFNPNLLKNYGDEKRNQINTHFSK